MRICGAWPRESSESSSRFSHGSERLVANVYSTQIGERGINLSGGQKQRICIARAAYAESGVVLLDDPLSAVDAQVGRHILHNCILNGPLADRTRILVTHHLEVLPYADHIVVMDSDGSIGRILQQGSYPVHTYSDSSGKGTADM